MVFVSLMFPVVLASYLIVMICGVAMRTTTLDTHKIIAACLWLINTTYLLFFAHENIYILAVALAILLLHACFVFLDGKDHILLTSALFCVVICMNLWGIEEYEIIALTLFVEISVWIITYFIINL